MSAPHAPCAVLALLCGLTAMLPLSARAEDAPPAVAAAPPKSDVRLAQDLSSLFDFVGVGDQIWLASKTQTSLSDAPAIVAVITQEDFERWGFTSLADALRTVPGYHLVDDHVTVNVAMRGVSGGEFAPSNLVKVLINNWSSDSFRSTGANWLGAEWVPMTSIKRVEMVRGPTSALFGSDAFLGAFNLVSKTGDDFEADRTALKLTLGGGLVGSNPRGFDLDASTGGRWGPVEGMLGARFVGDDRSGMTLPASSPRPQIPAYKMNDKAAGLDRQSLAVLGSVRYHIDENTLLEATPHFSFINRGEEFGALAQLTHGVDAAGVARGTQVQLAKGLVGLHLASELPHKLALDVAATGFWGGTLPGDRIDTGGVFFARRRFSYRGIDANAELRWEGLGFLGLRAGAELNLDFEDLPAVSTTLADATASTPAGYEVPGLSTVQRSGGFRNVGVVAEATYRPWYVPATLVGSFRFDNHSIYGNQINGRAALVGHLLAGLDFKVMAGTAFKAPSPFLLYASPVRVGDVLGNRSLRPQRVQTVEGELHYKPIEAVEASVVVSGSRLTSLATFATQGINRIALNSGTTDVFSVEANLKGHWNEHLFGYITSTFTRGTRVTGRIGYIAELVGQDLEAFPDWLSTAGIGTSFARQHLRLTVDVSSVGRQRASDSNIIAGAKLYTLPPYVLLSAQFALHEWVTPIGLVSARLVGTNLLGASTSAPGYGGVDYPLLPRSGYLYVSLSP